MTLTPTQTLTPTPTTNPNPSDFNSDGLVDIQDIHIVLNQIPLSLYTYALVVGNYGK